MPDRSLSFVGARTNRGGSYFMPAPRNTTKREDIKLPPRYYWAKTTKDNRPGISVRDHCLNVGYVAKALLNLLPKHLRKLLPPSVPTLAALHDIGKVSPGFLQKCPVWLDNC